jgi:hypothetical protein
MRNVRLINIELQQYCGLIFIIVSEELRTGVFNVQSNVQDITQGLQRMKASLDTTIKRRNILDTNFCK